MAAVIDAIHILDATCGAEALLEAGRLAGPDGCLCIGPPPSVEGWRVRRLPGGRVRTAGMSRLCRGGGGLLARLHAGTPACCWSVGAARRVIELLAGEPAPVAVRLAETPSARERADLAELIRLTPSMAVAAATPTTRRRLRSAGVDTDVHLIPPPARPPVEDGADREAARERLGIGPDDIAIAAPGAGGRRSGQRLGVWAAAILTIAELPVRLLLEDTGPASRRARDFGLEAGFAGAVVLVGAGVSLPELLSAADAALFAGADGPPPAALAAAMAAGLPLVAADVPAAGDWLVHESNALLVTPGSPRAAAQGLLRLIEDRALAGRLGAAADALAAERFDPGAVAGRWEALYAGLPEGRAAAGSAG